MLLVAALLLAQVPTVRTIKSQVLEERPLSICQLSVQASTVIRGKVLSVGGTVQLADANQAALYTPIEFQRTELLAGTAPQVMTIYALGEITAGRSQNNSLFAVGGNAVAFVVQHGGVNFIHAGGGWYWENVGSFTNAFSASSGALAITTMRQLVTASVAGAGGCSKVVVSPRLPNPPVIWPIDAGLR